jgi:hypothetical protein
MRSNGHGPSDVAETIGIMGVHQDIIRWGFAFHSTSNPDYYDMLSTSS